MNWKQEAMSQRVTKAGEKGHTGLYDWRMYEPDHRLSWNCEEGRAALEVRKIPEDRLEICATEAGKKTKEVYITPGTRCC
jgi:hypothetical protein